MLCKRLEKLEICVVYRQPPCQESNKISDSNRINPGQCDSALPVFALSIKARYCNKHPFPGKRAFLSKFCLNSTTIFLYLERDSPTMADARQPGSFILEIANRGQEVTSSLPLLFSSPEATAIANKISLSITTLAEAGTTVNKYADYFKDNFQSRLEKVLSKFAKVYEKIQAACDKASSWKWDSPNDDIEVCPKRPYEKLVWAFGMTVYDFDKFVRNLEEFHKPALLLNSMVKLVVLQVQGQQ